MAGPQCTCPYTQRCHCILIITIFTGLVLMGEDKGYQIVLSWDARTAQAKPPLNTGNTLFFLQTSLLWFFPCIMCCI